MHKNPLPLTIRLLIALSAGLILPLAFAPFGIFPISIISIALLLALWISCSNQKQAFWLGYVFGLASFGGGVSWIYISLQQFGNISPPLALLFTIGFIAYLSLYPAITGYVLTRFFPENMGIKYFCAFPVCWIALNWVQSFFMSGFPWLSLGYSQTNSYLRGYASVFSVYGVSLAILILSALIVYAISGNRKRRITCLCVFILIWVIGCVLTEISWTKPTGKTLSLSLIQGNIPQSIKWSPEHLKLSLQRYTALTEKNWQSNLIIWPETAIPLPDYMLAPFFNHLNQEALAHHSSLITGALVLGRNRKSFYNGLIALGNAKGVYFKRRLVPFGETLPNIIFLKEIFEKLGLPEPGLTPGPIKQGPLTVQGIPVTPFICYEIAFPEQVRLFTQRNGFLLTISDDTWFGHSLAPWQHLQMAQMRAVETGQMLVFVSNSGITAIVDAHGRIIAKAPPYKVTVLHGHVQAMAGHTPWQGLGFYLFLVILMGLLLTALKVRDAHTKRLRSE